MARFFVDRFSVGLDELTRKQQRSTKDVLRVLHQAGRFSQFEASDNDVIARTMTTIMAGDLVEKLGGAYPWTEVRLTDKGLALISDPRDDDKTPTDRVRTFEAVTTE